MVKDVAYFEAILILSKLVFYILKDKFVPENLE
jgi:hypothetical protein